MTGVRASLGQIRFHTIYEALQEAGIPYDDNNSSAVLVWHDSLKDIDYFKSLLPWQTVNRIPCINVLCRKAPFARIIQKITPFFPELYSFVPKSYILPFKNSDFVRAIARKKCKWIIKPDSGSLGQGITIIEPGSEYSPDETLAVAQEYIESFIVDEKKFDLRIYVLLASVSPLQIYVYRDGLARFCSQKTNEHSIYSQITNVGLNKDNPDVTDFSDISKIISDVFPKLKKEYGVNIEKLWQDIEDVIVLTILASHKFLVKGEEYQCPRTVFSRCFQILGFDILLDKELKPHVLEVNYRPSLEYHRAPERRLKVGMVRDAVHIAAPLQNIQSIVSARKWGWESDNWLTYISQNPEIEKRINDCRKEAMKNNKFKLIYPTTGEKQVTYDNVLEKVHQLPIDFLPGFRIHKIVKGGEA